MAGIGRRSGQVASRFPYFIPAFWLPVGSVLHCRLLNVSMPDPVMQSKPDAGLSRGIRRWDVTAVAVNGIIGAGIFGLPSETFSRLGVYSLLAFLACALVVISLVLCFAEVASRFDETGGPYLYAREAFGALAGFEVGWLTWLSRVTAFAANCNLLVEYLTFFWPNAKGALWRGLLPPDNHSLELLLSWRAVVIAAVVVLLTLVNVIGVRDAARATNLLTIGKLAPLALFIGVGLFFLRPGNFALPAALPAFKNFSKSVLLLIYAFTGFEIAVIPAGEASDPRRDIPKALLTAISMVAVVYMLIQITCIGTLPNLGDSARPLADASGQFLGRAGASIISAGALISILGNLNATLFSASRLPFAMAARGELPKILARTHPKFHTPVISILTMAALVLALTISGTFIYAATISAIARLLSYAATCAALPVLRRSSRRPARFRAPAGTLTAIAGLALSAWLLSSCSLEQARDTAIAAALGLAIYFGYKLKQRRQAPPTVESLP